jgi:hypothetical protein
MTAPAAISSSSSSSGSIGRQSLLHCQRAHIMTCLGIAVAVLCQTIEYFMTAVGCSFGLAGYACDIHTSALAAAVLQLLDFRITP